MKGTQIIIIAAASLLVMTGIPALGESVFLRDGSIIDGEIVSRSDKGITVKTGPAVREIGRENVLRTLSGEGHRETVLMHLADGSYLLCHIVETGDDYFITRKNIASPDEVRIGKEKVKSIFSRAFRPQLSRVSTAPAVSGKQPASEWAAGRAVSLFLRDGSTAEGKLSASGDDSITLETSPGRTQSFAKRSVNRIAAGDDYKKVAVLHLTGGRVARGYIVEENDRGIVFRESLYSPEEREVPAGDIRYMEIKKFRMLDKKSGDGPVKRESSPMSSVFLKDGTIIEGRITGSDGRKITVKIPDELIRDIFDLYDIKYENSIDILRNQVLRVVSGDDHKKYLFIQYRYDAFFEGHIVDESEKFYTLRGSLRSYPEMTLKKDHILNIYTEKTVVKYTPPFKGPGLTESITVGSRKVNGYEETTARDIPPAYNYGFLNERWYFSAGFIGAYPTGTLGKGFDGGMGMNITARRSYIRPLSMGLSVNVINFTRDNSTTAEQLFTVSPQVSVIYQLRISNNFGFLIHGGAGYSIEKFEYSDAGSDKPSLYYGPSLSARVEFSGRAWRDFYVTPFAMYEWILSSGGHMGIFSLGVGILF